MWWGGQGEMGGGVWAGGCAARPHFHFPRFLLPTPQSNAGKEMSQYLPIPKNPDAKNTEIP